MPSSGGKSCSRKAQRHTAAAVGHAMVAAVTVRIICCVCLGSKLHSGRAYQLMVVVMCMVGGRWHKGDWR